MAERGEFQRALESCNDLRRIAEQRPAPRQARQQVGAVLETAAADDAGTIAARRQSVERIEQTVRVDRAAQKIDARMRGAEGKRILIAEGIGHQRHETRAPRGSGQRPTRGGGDQHRPSPIH